MTDGHKGHHDDEPAFEYRPVEGVLILWHLTLSGYEEDENVFMNGDFDSMDNLSEVEATLENLEGEYAASGVASPVHVRGDHGWREYEWSNGHVHRYQWKYAELDMRCAHCKSTDNDLYMVHDELWESSRLDGYACFRCLEEAIGRQLVPEDFKPDVPGNDPGVMNHGPELRKRLGTASQRGDSETAITEEP